MLPLPAWESCFHRYDISAAISSPKQENCCISIFLDRNITIVEDMGMEGSA
jgi:hypothetical protein